MVRRHSRLGGLSAFFALAVALALLPPARPAHAANFVVTRTDDPVPDGCAVGDCSLREAFLAANASAGNAITLPAGTYDLQLAPPTFGELAIAKTVSLNGAGA